MRNLVDPASAAAAGDGDGGAAMEFEAADPGAAAGDGSGMSYGLNLRRLGDGGGGAPVAAAAPKRKSMESVTLERFREDMQILPDHREMEEFKDIKIEDFGKALLAGYGWKEGQGIGRNAKEDVKVFEFVRRPGTQGFGFVAPEGMRPPGKKGRKEPAPAPTPVDDSRRTRRGEDGGVSAGQVVRVVDGRHAGLKGKVVGRSDGGDGAAPGVVLELLQSGVKVSVGVDQVAELGSMEEERCLRKLKELRIRERESSSSDHRKKESRREDRKRDNKRGSDGGRRREGEPVSWLRNHIRVRIVSKEFRGGKLYLKKGEVMDVVSPTTCDISMDDSREIIQGVGQELLETALPKRGGPVLVLFGKHQGVFGNLVERNMDMEIGVVRDADSHQLFNVKLEQIAEYLGDPSYLGY